MVARGRRRQPRAGEKRGSATGASPVDRARNGSKHHLLVDATGIPLAWTLTGGNRHDITQLIPLVDRVPPVRGGRGLLVRPVGVRPTPSSADPRAVRARRVIDSAGLEPKRIRSARVGKSVGKSHTKTGRFWRSWPDDCRQRERAQSRRLAGLSALLRGGRYWARTSDPQVFGAGENAATPSFSSRPRHLDARTSRRRVGAAPRDYASNSARSQAPCRIHRPMSSRVVERRPALAALQAGGRRFDPGTLHLRSRWNRRLCRSSV